MVRSGLLTCMVSVALVVGACGADEGSPKTAATESVVDSAPAVSDVGEDASGEAPLPASLSFTVESETSAQATVTLADGGTVSATAADGTTFELVVPAMAVAEDTQITMTPLTNVEGVTTEAGVVHAVQLEPEGQLFFDVARLTITPATPIAVADQLMFEAGGDGAHPGPALIDPRSGPIVILLDHFTVEGVAEVTSQQRALFLRKSAENSERRIQREAAAAIQAVRERQLLGASDGEGDNAALAEELGRLMDEYDREVVDKLRQAATASCEGLDTYISTMVGAERARQLLGMGDSTEAMNARISEALSAMTARFDECEKEAIVACTAAKDPALLVKFWLTMKRPPDPDRAKQICDPQGYQFEMIGTGTGYDTGYAVPIEWEVWGLLCKGSEEWKIWENFEGVQGGSTTGPPSNGQSVPYLVTFDENGAITSISWALYGNIPPGTTMSGSTFALQPGDQPTKVVAQFNAGAGVARLQVEAPVEPADGSIPGCELDATP